MDHKFFRFTGASIFGHMMTDMFHHRYPKYRTCYLKLHLLTDNEPVPLNLQHRHLPIAAGPPPPGLNVAKMFLFTTNAEAKKLKCLSPASFSRLVKYFRLMRDVDKQEIITRNNHSSLFKHNINDKDQMFYSIDIFFNFY